MKIIHKSYKFRIYPNEDLELKDRNWTCPSCNTSHDRDFNASQNILKQGLNILNSGCGMQSEDKQKRVEALPLGKSMKLEAPYPLGSE